MSGLQIHYDFYRNPAVALCGSGAQVWAAPGAAYSASSMPFWGHFLNWNGGGDVLYAQWQLAWTPGTGGARLIEQSDTINNGKVIAEVLSPPGGTFSPVVQGNVSLEPYFDGLIRNAQSVNIVQQLFGDARVYSSSLQLFIRSSNDVVAIT